MLKISRMKPLLAVVLSACALCLPLHARLVTFPDPADAMASPVFPLMVNPIPELESSADFQTWEASGLLGPMPAEGPQSFSYKIPADKNARFFCFRVYLR